MDLAPKVSNNALDGLLACKKSANIDKKYKSNDNTFIYLFIYF